MSLRTPLAIMSMLLFYCLHELHVLPRFSNRLGPSPWLYYDRIKHLPPFVVLMMLLVYSMLLSYSLRVTLESSSVMQTMA